MTNDWMKIARELRHVVYWRYWSRWETPILYPSQNPCQLKYQHTNLHRSLRHRPQHPCNSWIWSLNPISMLKIANSYSSYSRPFFFSFPFLLYSCSCTPWRNLTLNGSKMRGMAQGSAVHMSELFQTTLRCSPLKTTPKSPNAEIPAKWHKMSMKQEYKVGFVLSQSANIKHLQLLFDIVAIYLVYLQVQVIA